MYRFQIGDLTDNFIVQDVSTPSRPLCSILLRQRACYATSSDEAWW
ncbi:hypothetical protein VCRA2119O147_890023 [Vibrio crassostreae]|nr:hypothetical protein VCRA2116O234_130113 [Vibrio crassostreae]CAK1771509.1 hypothetical protein VCRA2110O177_150022 [Vibrio crassostreae]CAK1778833.1 hypothetical protein VCRA2110O181_150098 [Vibrio crassostreae]CAK1791118.1 hypothetical protein VCRA2112O189_160022 [Vibrio crassostreae]CAK1792332.1 hypothetical protein VCRA2113O220_160098 [Vibrio crassostreae]